MTATARLLVLELRRSTGLVVAGPAVLLGLLVTWQDHAFWLGDWHATGIQVRFSVLLAGPLLAAGAARSAGRAKRNGHAAMAVSTSRPAWTAVALQWIAYTLWALLAYAIVVLAASIATASAHAAGHPWWSYSTLGAGAVVAFCAIGHAAGNVFRSRLTPPITGINVNVPRVGSIPP